MATVSQSQASLKIFISAAFCFELVELSKLAPDFASSLGLFSALSSQSIGDERYYCAGGAVTVAVPVLYHWVLVSGSFFVSDQWGEGSCSFTAYVWALTHAGPTY